MSGDRAWAATLRDACEWPAETAAAWRAGGGHVVGLLGWSAPRELVAAAGLLPVRLSPEGLARQAGARGLDSAAQPGTTGAFGRELAPATAGFAAALLSGALGWIDFLVIGRDREDYTRLFYLLRELRRSGSAPDLVPVAFFDLLRLPSRTSARYNRQRAAALTAVIAGWAGRPVTPSDLAGAAEAEREIAHSFGGIQALRTRPQPAITGTDALAAAIAARVVPVGRLRPLLAAALASAGSQQAVTGTGPAARVFLAGSGTDDLTVYAELEDLGIAIVGEDHEWGDNGGEYPQATRDPLDGIVDRYQFAHGGAARAGLRDRVLATVDRVQATGAEGVLYLLGPHDEAARWELPALREHLGHGIPLVSVRLQDPWDTSGDPWDTSGPRRPSDACQAGRNLLAVLGADEAAGATHG